MYVIHNNSIICRYDYFQNTRKYKELFLVK